MTKRQKVYCDDWSCPARVSCAHHFGRSSAYGKVNDRAKVESIEGTGRFNWMQGLDAGVSCVEYRFDNPKAFLMPKPGQITHYPEAWL